ncbi:unnamed protein product [Linum tenue]|uniref:Uncharacterized protein n=1 Tax=Linum tenue TaxID=586396 RepID=A0AAV0KTN6_9ROSI|nr:unnamed protein product [Linum tenue]
MVSNCLCWEAIAGDLFRVMVDLW